jgi:hypothetical protein
LILIWIIKTLLVICNVLKNFADFLVLVDLAESHKILSSEIGSVELHRSADQIFFPMNSLNFSIWGSIDFKMSEREPHENI